MVELWCTRRVRSVSLQWGSGGRAPSGVQGQRTWSGDHGAKPPEAGSILIADAKNKTKIKKMNSNNIQMERIGAGAKQRLNRRWQRWASPSCALLSPLTQRLHHPAGNERDKFCAPIMHRETSPRPYNGKSNLLVHGQVTIIFVVSVCLFVCAEFFSAVIDPISINLGHVICQGLVVSPRI